MSEARLVGRWESFPATTIAGLLDWAAERDLAPDAVTVTGGHLKWQTPETDEERVRRENAERASDAKREVWEREAYERLAAKYGPLAQQPA